MTPARPHLLAVIPDLFFYTRFRETAMQLGFEVSRVEPSALAAAAVERRPAAVFVELDPDTAAVVEEIRAIKSNPARAGTPVVAFGAHTLTDLFRAARETGCDAVLARGEFTDRLPELLKQHGQAETKKGFTSE